MLPVSESLHLFLDVKFHTTVHIQILISLSLKQELEKFQDLPDHISN